jgi:cell division transport system permease protein
MSKGPSTFLPDEQTHRGLLNWVIGIMVFLTGMAVVAGLQLGIMADGWRQSAAGSLTVQIVAVDAQDRQRQARTAIEVLKKTPGVAAAVVIGDDAMAALLEPWIGETSLTEKLPIPAMINVTLMQGVTIDLDALESLLQAKVPNARVDTHEQWLDDLLSLARAAQMIAVAVIVMMMVATVAIVVFTARSSMLAQRETVEIVHLLGAKDSLIAGAFQKRFWSVGLRGGLIGLLLIGLVIGGLYALSLNVQSAYLPRVTFHLETAIILCLLPAVTGLVTMWTARVTVNRALQDMV